MWDVGCKIKGLRDWGIKGEKRRKGIKPSFHPLPSSVRHLSRMCPWLSPNNNGFAIGIDNAALEELFQGFPQLVSIAKVVIQDPFLHIDPVPSPDLYDFHGNHPLSLWISDSGLRIENKKTLNKNAIKNPEPLGLGACRHKSERTHQGRLETNFRRTEPSPRSCWLIWTTTKVQLLLDGSSNLFSCLQIKSHAPIYVMLFPILVKSFFSARR